MTMRQRRPVSAANYLVFPLLMVGCLWLASGLMSAGMNDTLTLLIVILGVAIPAILALEHWLPFREQWSRSHGDVAADTTYLLLIQFIWPRVLTAFWLAVLAGSTAWLAARWAPFDGATWPHDWPLPLQLSLALVIAEFGRYWIHRWAHEVPLLWRFHAIHHSPHRLYWLNAARFHPLEKIWLHIPETLPFIVLGANPEVLVLYYVFTGVHGMLQHSNIDVRLGPLNYIFAMSELHRFHHSKIIAESNNNYGNNLILWDLIFGSFFWPREREVGEIGLLNPEYPQTVWGQTLAPFHRDPLDKPAVSAES